MGDETLRYAESAVADLHAREALASVEVDIDKNRRINALVVSFLKLHNGTVSEKTILDDFTARDDIFSDVPFEDIESARVSGSGLQGYKDALRIARFYFENKRPDIQIPTRAVFHSQDGDNPKVSNSPEEKVLVVVQRGSGAGGGKKDMLRFSDTRRSGLRGEVSQARPDVYLQNVDYYTWNGGIKSDITISGCDNLLVAGKIEFFETNINLACEGTCAILPGATIMASLAGESGDRSKISIQARGDIIQYPDTTVRVRKIDCKDYYRLGGKIFAPTPENCTITCHGGEFFDRGGEPIDEVTVAIDDNKKLDRMESPLALRRAANKSGLPPATRLGDSPMLTDSSQEASLSAGEDRRRMEIAEELDSLAKPIIERERDGVVVRGYNLPVDDPAGYTRFIITAQSAGWRVDREQQVGTIMSVTLSRSSKI